MAFITALPSAIRSATARLTPRCSAPPPTTSRRSFLAATTAAAAGFAFLTPKMASAEPRVNTEDITVGTGATFTSNDNVHLHYTLTLGGFEEQGGKVVDSSRTRGKTFSYKYDTGAVIKGWDMGVTGMRVGGHRRLVIPSELGYGARGAGGAIPPNSTLYFDIELVRVGY